MYLINMDNMQGGSHFSYNTINFYSEVRIHWKTYHLQGGGQFSYIEVNFLEHVEKRKFKSKFSISTVRLLWTEETEECQKLTSPKIGK